MEEKWLSWAKRLQAIAQAGLAYSENPFDLDRFQQIRDLSAEILREYTGVSMEKVQTLFCGEEGYQTPKVDVRAVVFQDDRLLLVKEKNDGCWSLPGGWAEVHLTIRENAIKEAKEEAGLDVLPQRLIAVLDSGRIGLANIYGIYKIFVLCDLLGGEFRPNDETEDSGFFSLDHLPPLSIKRCTPEQVRLCFAAHENEEFLPVFN